MGRSVQVSAAGGPSAARHALTIGPDGSLWAAWAQIGEAEATQQLVLRRSRDQGRTWEAPIRASRPDVGLVGVPALVMSADASFVGFTDGERGTVLVQTLNADGSPTGDPVALRTTTRNLYGDAPFLDGGVAAAAVDGRGLVVGHDGTGLWRATSAAPGEPWVDESWYSGAAYGPPRLVAVDGKLTALVTLLNGDGYVQISSEASSDGGQTWQGWATWMDPAAGDASLAVAPDQSTVLWESCDRFCTAPIIRVGEVEAADGRSSRIDGPAGRPTGALLTEDTMVVAWIEEGPDYDPSSVGWWSPRARAPNPSRRRGRPPSPLARVDRRRGARGAGTRRRLPWGGRSHPKGRAAARCAP